MVLYIIGLGLCDEKDITVRGLDAVRSCARVFLEAYTSILTVGTEKLEALYGKSVTVADRETVESNADLILEGADTEDVAFLVVGDPFSATTHTDLQLRARARGIPVTTIPNASALTAVGACGLSLYRFGGAVSLVFFTETWRPDSWYDRLASNRAAGLHTLCLLDIKVKEPTLASLARGGPPVYEPPRFMSAATAAAQLIEVEETRAAEGRPCGAYTADTLVVGLARLGAGGDQTIVAAPLRELARRDLGPPLHCLVVPAGELTDIEAEALEAFKGVAVPVLAGAEDGGGGESSGGE